MNAVSPFLSDIRLPERRRVRQLEKHRPTAFAFREVSKRFGTQTILKRLDVEVAEGEFVAVIGKSGCGKSTMLRLLAGLEAPTEGTIVQGGAARDRAAHADIRIMFQEPRLLPWESTLDNVAVGLTGLAAQADARARAQAILGEVGLADRAGEWPSVLSGGQRQRVALARALVGQPRILALDEPLGALDALTRIEMQGLLERIWQAKGFTAVLVTHDVAEAVVLADRIIVLDHGRIALDIPVDLPRPRRHGDPEAAAIEARVLARLFGDGEH